MSVLESKACPSPEAIGRAFSEQSDVHDEHLRECERCREEWSALEMMADLGRSTAVRLPDPGEAEHLENVVVRRALSTPSKPDRRWAVTAAGIAVCAVLGGLAAHGLRSFPPASPAAERRSERPLVEGRRVRASAESDFERRREVSGGRGAKEREILRLREGRIHVTEDGSDFTDPLRIEVGDATLEIESTDFVVVADGDRLTDLWVKQGTVRVHGATPAPRVLLVGQRWSRASSEPPAKVPPAVEAKEPEEQTASPAEREERRPRTRAAAKRRRVARPAPPDRSLQAEAAFAEGWSLLRAGRHREAARAFGRVRILDDRHPLAEDAAFWRVIALGRGDDLQAYVPRHRDSDGLTPALDAPERRTAFGSLRYAYPQHAPAPRATTRHADHPASTDHNPCGEVLGAMRAFLSRFPGSPKRGEVAVLLGWRLLDEGRMKEAADLFTSALEDPSSSVAESARRGLERASAAD